jgi:hypothetical protein
MFELTIAGWLPGEDGQDETNPSQGRHCTHFNPGRAPRPDLGGFLAQSLQEGPLHI